MVWFILKLKKIIYAGQQNFLNGYSILFHAYGWPSSMDHAGMAEKKINLVKPFSKQDLSQILNQCPLNTPIKLQEENF